MLSLDSHRPFTSKPSYTALALHCSLFLFTFRPKVSSVGSFPRAFPISSFIDTRKRSLHGFYFTTTYISSSSSSSSDHPCIFIIHPSVFLRIIPCSRLTRRQVHFKFGSSIHYCMALRVVVQRIFPNLLIVCCRQNTSTNISAFNVQRSTTIPSYPRVKDYSHYSLILYFHVAVSLRHCNLYISNSIFDAIESHASTLSSPWTLISRNHSLLCQQ